MSKSMRIWAPVENPSKQEVFMLQKQKQKENERHEG